MDERTRNIAAIAAAVIVLVGVGYFIWSHSAPPEPTIPAGQTIQNPFGNKQPGGPRAAAPGGGTPAPAPTASTAAPPPPGVPPMPGAAPGPGGMSGMPAPSNVPVPAKGTADPQMGFGPSRGAPIPGR